jgi:hypothetical protein
MKILKLINSTVLVLVLGVVFAAGPVFAQSGNDDQHDRMAVAAKTNNETAEADSSTTDSSQSDDSSNNDIHKKGAEMVAEMRKQHQKGQTAPQRQKKCEAHKQGLTTKFSHIVTNSQRIDDHITSILNKAMAYQQDNNIQVDNFADLAGKANAAAAKAAASIATLKTVTPTLDCNSASVASDVANFKAAAQQTRSSLKDYKTAVHNLLKALENAKETANTEGSQQ